MIQFTPPGSKLPSSSATTSRRRRPAPREGLYLIVSDIEAARAELIARGVEVGEVFHGAGDVHAGTDEPYIAGRVGSAAPIPQRGSYRSLRLVQRSRRQWLAVPGNHHPPARPRRGRHDLRFVDRSCRALRRAAAAHGEHEKRTGGVHDENWPDWYADYIVKEQAGEALPLRRAAGTHHAGTGAGADCSFGTGRNVMAMKNAPRPMIQEPT